MILRLEFRVLTRETRGAVLVRAWTDQTDRFARTGYRVAIRGENGSQEAFGQVRGLSKPVQTTAPVADLPPPTPGEWQQLEVECVGDAIEVRINGQVVHAATGAEPNAGLIGIEIEEGVLEVRNTWLTKVVAEVPVGIDAVADLPDHAVRPRVRLQVPPRYSLDARSRGIQGKVQVEGVIGVDGRASYVQIVRSLIPDLDAEAIAAVRQWRFDPATVDGAPVPSVAQFELSFTLH